MSEEEDLKSARKRGTYVGAVMASLIIGLPSLGTSVTALMSAGDAVEADSKAKDPIMEGLLIDVRMCAEYVAETEARLIGLERVVYRGDPELAEAATRGIHVEVPELASHTALRNLMVAVARAKGLPTAALGLHHETDFIEAPISAAPLESFDIMEDRREESSAGHERTADLFEDDPPLPPPPRAKKRKRRLRMETEQLQLPKQEDIGLAY